MVTAFEIIWGRASCCPRGVFSLDLPNREKIVGWLLLLRVEGGNLALLDLVMEEVQPSEDSHDPRVSGIPEFHHPIRLNSVKKNDGDSQGASDHRQRSLAGEARIGVSSSSIPSAFKGKIRNRTSNKFQCDGKSHSGAF